ncbi:GTPase-activating protein SED4 KNAG_0I02870 [Huiozyma naganishii CBS 8797]|uniref:Guanine nucleotide-exchange factor SEC12 n=1 Tax=Huiozyma naganishii (strain ATCC MYA-139 / BCRC 22969 / CBS 8797 / KCTC 17520 / NBRC 10181 / NCYC 3082 / Yp74L-3) TaxID=1071383 RepID=J7SAD7_HUIN7|nr:hypothetical protein KNAG_0I02870 [Kazachstania naganishii CBS 8797]CCK72071.1 hypothetical protein KNAG_0I02870 [Kazachstania naganishii CBS 8797]
MKFASADYSVGYPMYGATFLSDDVLLVTGGGDADSGSPLTKLTALRVDLKKKKVMKRFREITLEQKDNSATALDSAFVAHGGAVTNLILLGCNETVPLGEPNHHLRKFFFENAHLKYESCADFNRSSELSEYTKLVRLCKDGSVAAIASSKLPTTVRIIDPVTMVERYEIETGRDVRDLCFSPDGKVVAYVTETSLEVISIVTGRFIIRKTDFDANQILSKVNFLNNDTILVAASLIKDKLGVVLSVVSIKSKEVSILKSKTIKGNFKGITSMDVDNKGELAVLAVSGSSLLVIKLKDLSTLKVFKSVHQLEITKVRFSPNSRMIATVSPDKNVHLVVIPEGLAKSTSFGHKLLKVLLNLFFAIGIVAVSYFVHKYDLHSKSYKYLNEKYFTKPDVSGYFHMNDRMTTTTDIFDDIIRINTLTRPVDTPSHYTRQYHDAYSRVESVIHSAIPTLGPQTTSEVYTASSTSSKSSFSPIVRYQSDLTKVVLSSQATKSSLLTQSEIRISSTEKRDTLPKTSSPVQTMSSSSETVTSAQKLTESQTVLENIKRSVPSASVDPAVKGKELKTITVDGVVYEVMAVKETVQEGEHLTTAGGLISTTSLIATSSTSLTKPSSSHILETSRVESSNSLHAISAKSSFTIYEEFMSSSKSSLTSSVNSPAVSTTSQSSSADVDSKPSTPASSSSLAQELTSKDIPVLSSHYPQSSRSTTLTVLEKSENSDGGLNVLPTTSDSNTISEAPLQTTPTLTNTLKGNSEPDSTLVTHDSVTTTPMSAPVVLTRETTAPSSASMDSTLSSAQESKSVVEPEVSSHLSDDTLQGIQVLDTPHQTTTSTDVTLDKSGSNDKQILEESSNESHNIATDSILDIVEEKEPYVTTEIPAVITREVTNSFTLTSVITSISESENSFTPDILETGSNTIDVKTSESDFVPTASDTDEGWVVVSTRGIPATSLEAHGSFDAEEKPVFATSLGVALVSTDISAAPTSIASPENTTKALTSKTKPTPDFTYMPSETAGLDQGEVLETYVQTVSTENLVDEQPFVGSEPAIETTLF